MPAGIRPERRASTAGKLAAVAAAVVTVAALSACGSSSSSSTASASSSTASQQAPGNATSGTINWWANTITNAGADPRQVLVQKFEQQYPNIKVNIITAPADTDTDQATLTTQISGGGGPDVYMGDVTWPAQFGQHQYALDLSKYLPQSYFNSFAPGFVAGTTYQNGVYAAPWYSSEGFLYYRKDLLAEDHLPVPTTWEQLVSEAQQIQAKHQTQYGYVFQGASYEGLTCDYIEDLADAGGSVLNSAGTQSELANGQAGVQAATFLRSLITSGVSPAAVTTYQEAQSLDEFDAGNAAFMRYWSAGYPTSQAAGTKVVGKVGVAPLPTFQGQSYPGYSSTGGWNLYVNPHSKNVAADLTFIKFLTSPAAEDILATQFSLVPTVQSVRTDPSITSATPVLAVVPKTKVISRPSQSPEYPDISQAVYQAINAAIAGQKTPAAAVSAANSAITTAIAGGGL